MAALSACLSLPPSLCHTNQYVHKELSLLVIRRMLPHYLVRLSFPVKDLHHAKHTISSQSNDGFAKKKKIQIHYGRYLGPFIE